jgi:hypothetical protein
MMWAYTSSTVISESRPYARLRFPSRFEHLDRPSITRIDQYRNQLYASQTHTPEVPLVGQLLQPSLVEGLCSFVLTHETQCVTSKRQRMNLDRLGIGGTGEFLGSFRPAERRFETPHRQSGAAEEPQRPSLRDPIIGLVKRRHDMVDAPGIGSGPLANRRVTFGEWLPM